MTSTEKRWVTFTAELAKRLDKHVKERYGNIRGTKSIIVVRALQEYLDKEEKDATGS